MAGKKRKTPYETLGVDQSATDAEVKRAYRKKARASHPDKGGDTTAMAEINHAFDVLGDPKRRALYEATGEEEPNRRTIEQEVRNLLLQAFAQALQEDAPNVLGRAMAVVVAGEGKIEADKTSGQALKTRLERKRDKIRVNGKGENVFHMLVDSEIARIATILAELDRRIVIHQAAIAALKEYTSTEEVRIADLMGAGTSGSIFYFRPQSG